MGLISSAGISSVISDSNLQHYTVGLEIDIFSPVITLQMPIAPAAPGNLATVPFAVYDGYLKVMDANTNVWSNLHQHYCHWQCRKMVNRDTNPDCAQWPDSGSFQNCWCWLTQAECSWGFHEHHVHTWLRDINGNIYDEYIYGVMSTLRHIFLIELWAGLIAVRVAIKRKSTSTSGYIDNLCLIDALQVQCRRPVTNVHQRHIHKW